MPQQVDLLEGAAAYVEKHKVFQLFEGLLEDLILKRPDDPIAHLIKALKCPEQPRVIVVGPPGAQARALCEQFSSQLGLVHVVASDVYRDLAKSGSPLGKEAKALVDNNQDIPSDMLLKLLQEKLSTPDCINKGWVLEGYPSTATQARAMLAGGVLPTCVLSLLLDDDEVMRRLTGRRVDPEGNQVYHLTDMPPPEAIMGRLIQRPDDTEERVAERLANFRDAMAGAIPLFKKTLKEVDASMPEGELVAACLPLVATVQPTKAPRGCPRVLLLGGPGSGAQELGAALAQRFGAKLISAPDLMQAAALNGSQYGRQAAPFLESGIAEQVPDECLLPLVLSRLDSEDVRKVGFVMVGCPANPAQAAALKKKGVWFRHVVFLQISPEDAKRVVCDTRYDPVDGTMYHPDQMWPEELEVAQRLVAHPHHQPRMLANKLKNWEGVAGKLLKSVSSESEVLVEDATAPVQELIERLTPCFLTL